MQRPLTHITVRIIVPDLSEFLLETDILNMSLLVRNRIVVDPE